MAEPSIGKLRWPVIIATRNQTPDQTTGIAEAYINRQECYAEITPVGLQTWIGGEQIGTPITHRVTIRWREDVDMFDVLLRNVIRPDQTTRTEVFRIRRCAEWQGRQRYLIMDVEQETRDG